MYRKLMSVILAFLTAFPLCAVTSYAAEMPDTTINTAANECEAGYQELECEEENDSRSAEENTATSEAEEENQTEKEVMTETEVPAQDEAEKETGRSTETEVTTETGMEAEPESQTVSSIMSNCEAETEAFEEGAPDCLFQAGGFKVLNEDKGFENAISLFSTGDMDELAGYIYTALKNREQSIEVKDYAFYWDNSDDRNQLLTLYYAVINDHPDLYYARTGYGVSYNKNTNLISKITPNYYTGIDDEAFEAGVQEAKSAVSAGMDDLQKAIAIHDYLVLNCEYDKERLANGTIPQESYGAYGALANRIAVCQGYALAYKYLMNEFGIECYIVTSDKMNHAWNIVRIGGELYQVDATWDDPTWDKYGLVSHTYLFQSDGEFQTSSSGHSRHYDWYVTKGSGIVDIKAEGTKYDNAFWRDVKSPLVYDNSKNPKYYYVSSDKELQSRACSMNQIDAEPVTLIILDTPYSGLALCGTKLYYNTNKKIAYIDIGKSNDGSYAEQVRYMVEDGDADNIYGFTRSENIVRYVKRTSYLLSGKSPIYFFDDSKDIIRYELDGGKNDPVNPDKYDGETEDIMLADPTREGYVFQGWYAEPDFQTKVTTIEKGSVGNLTLYAKWVPEKYAITYELDGGQNSSLNKAEYDMETETFPLANPTKKGCVFEGWYGEPDYRTIVTAIEKGSKGARTVYAKWKILEYKLEYELNGGTNNAENPTKYNVETDTIHLKDPKQEDGHYVFEGWYTDKDFTNKISEIESGSVGDRCLYAKWTKYYDVRFLDVSGKTIAEGKVAEGEDARPPEADVPEGYAFAMWDKDYTNVQEDLDITAVYEAIPYSITYVLGGGANSGKNPDTYTIETEDFRFAAPKHKNSQLAFAGWYRDKNYKERIISITKGSIGDITLYAKWKSVKAEDTIGGSHADETTANENKAPYNNAANDESRDRDTINNANDINTGLVTDGREPAVADTHNTPGTIDSILTDKRTGNAMSADIGESDAARADTGADTMAAEEDAATEPDFIAAENDRSLTENHDTAESDTPFPASEEEKGVNYRAFLAAAFVLAVIMGLILWIYARKKKYEDRTTV